MREERKERRQRRKEREKRRGEAEGNERKLSATLPGGKRSK